MKKLLFLILAATLSIAASSAQKLRVGDKLPETKTVTWLNNSPSVGKFLFTGFYHTANSETKKHLDFLDKIAATYASELQVTAIYNEGRGVIESQTQPSSRHFSVGKDTDGATFNNFGVQFVPFCVISDPRGRIVWLGNPSSISAEELGGYLN